MKKQTTLFVALGLLLSLLTGCAQMTVEQVPEKYAVEILVSTEKAILGTEDTNQEDAELIARGLISNLDSAFNFEAAGVKRDNITINIEIKYYSVMLKLIPPRRHWVTYKVKIVDNKRNKVLGYKTFEDGQPAITDLIEEMTENISEFLLSRI